MAEAPQDALPADAPVVGLATCAEYPDLEPPERLVLAPLAARGVRGEPVVWDDPSVDWSRFDLVVLRNTWDYPDRRAQFLRWADAVDAVTPLLNPPPVVRWNTDKRYLGDLAEAGIPTVPTRFLSPDGAAGDGPVLPDRGEYVVKPTISAGSRDTARYQAGVHDEVALRHVRGLLAAGREVMVQPYVGSVDEHGETALLHLDGQFSHAIRKGPLLAPGAPPTEDLFAREDIRPRTPDPAERQVAGQVMDWLAAAHGRLLYARVDLLATPSGPVVLEVELTEPSLFIETDPVLPDRLAAAIVDRLRTSHTSPRA